MHSSGDCGIDSREHHYLAAGRSLHMDRGRQASAHSAATPAV